MSYQYKGRGLLQHTGRNMNNSVGAFTAQPTTSLPLTISGNGLGINNGIMNTISLSHLSNTTSSFNWIDTLNPLVKKYEVFESTEDIIACAVASHRIMKESSIYYKLLDSGLFSKITAEDRTKSQEIKDYYSKRIMMLKLKSSRKMSTFREDMNKLIHSDCMTFRENMIGVAYWLPEFHRYDTQMDDIKAKVSTNQNFEQLNKDGKPNSLKLSVDLEPLGRVNRRTKRSKTFEYWFKDTGMDAAVSIQLEEKNQLQHLWDHLYNTEKVLKIKGNYIRRTLDDFEYYSVNSWEIDRG